MIPQFLDLSFRVTNYTGDAADPATTVINAVRTELAAMGWTEPVASTMLSPARTDGLQFSVALSKATNTRVAYVVKDKYGRLINNDTDSRQDIGLGGNLTVYCGAYYLYVEVTSGSLGNSFWHACCLHREPDQIATPCPVYLVSRGIANNGSTSYKDWWLGWAAWNGPGTTSITFVATVGPTYNGIDFFTPHMTMCFRPAEWCESTWYLGRMPNLLVADVSQLGGTTFTVPLDETHTGTFRMLQINCAYNMRPAVRVA
jgi:hypothetical protein